jgi:putative two-component system response regulator
VIASVLATASDRERYLVAGADDVMIKPFRLSDLIAVVARLTRVRSAVAPPSGLLASVEPATPAIKALEAAMSSHSGRVAELASRLAQQLHLSPPDVDVVRTAAELHDLGMIGVRDDVMSKQGPLTAEDWEDTQRHPDTGADMIKLHQALAPAAALVRHHHERWDGSGYPLGLKGTEIPLGARIIAVADSFDAITNYRVFRPNHLTNLEAVQDISLHSGFWYDPVVVDALRTLYE